MCSLRCPSEKQRGLALHGARIWWEGRRLAHGPGKGSAIWC